MTIQYLSFIFYATLEATVLKTYHRIDIGWLLKFKLRTTSISVRLNRQIQRRNFSLSG